jgi:alpha-tubulin suppressor-like RCC1 family protein
MFLHFVVFSFISSVFAQQVCPSNTLKVEFNDPIDKKHKIFCQVKKDGKYETVLDLSEPRISEAPEKKLDVVPLVSKNPEDILGLSINSFFHCFILRSGELKCWNRIGDVKSTQYVAQNFESYKNVKSIQIMHDGEMCLLLENKNFQCLNSKYDIIEKDSLPQILDFSFGFNFKCVVLNINSERDEIKCIGEYAFAGEGTKQEKWIQVQGITEKIISIKSSFRHTCALLKSGKVQCWGGNASGEVGIGKISDGEKNPVYVKNLDSVKDIALGNDSTCALLNSKKVKCWGRNSRGNKYDKSDGLGYLQTGSKELNVLEPELVKDLENVAEIDMKFGDICALIEGGAVKCWGDSYIKLKKDSPVKIENITSAKSVHVGLWKACTVEEKNKIKCWGYKLFESPGITEPLSPFSVNAIEVNAE